MNEYKAISFIIAPNSINIKTFPRTEENISYSFFVIEVTLYFHFVDEDIEVQRIKEHLFICEHTFIKNS